MQTGVFVSLSKNSSESCHRHISEWRQHCEAFEYCGKGIKVSTDPVAPNVFPCAQCNSETGGTIASGFYPEILTIAWNNISGKALTAAQYPPVLKNNMYWGQFDPNKESRLGFKFISSETVGKKCQTAKSGLNFNFLTCLSNV